MYIVYIGGVIIGILFVSILSWFRGTTFTFFPDNDEGNDKFDFFKQIVEFHTIEKTGFVLFKDINLFDWDVWFALLTFLYVDLLDTTGTLYSMASFAGIIDPNTGDFEGQTTAFSTDAIGTIVGSLLGLSPVTTFVESGAGIQSGGKTGVTSIVTSILFLISIVFTPIFSSIPPWYIINIYLYQYPWTYIQKER